MFYRIIVLILIISCVKEEAEKPFFEEDLAISPDSSVQVLSVSHTASAQDYTFTVQLASPDTGCDQYADWWEVISTAGELIYRRNLSHSHVNEQPFTRSGGPVTVNENDTLIVRGHMNNFSYGSIVMKGTIAGGFQRDTISASFAEELKNADPQPPNCAF